MSWLNGWSYRKAITIDSAKIDEDLTDFPIPVKLTSSNFDFSKAQSNGNDIRFTSDDGETLLKYERERHDSANSIAEYWVKIPSVSSSADTVFYIYYGNDSASDGADPANVWDSNFKGVWHLNQDPSGTAPQELDSTANNNDGTSNGSMTSDDLVDAKVGKGLEFDGSDDYIDCGDGTNIAYDEITLSCLVNLNGTDNANCFGRNLSGNNEGDITLFSTGSKLALQNYSADYQAESNDAPTTGVWYHLVGTVDSEGGTLLYVNGVLQDTKASYRAIQESSSENFIMGAWLVSTGASGFLNGKLDEVRLSNIARSAAYIKASFHSENDSLVTFGSLEVANLFDGKLVIIGSDIVDGKIDIKDTTGISLDGKIALDEPTDYFDGLIDIKDSIGKTLDGVIDIKDTSLLVFDGKAIIRSAGINLLDGMVHPVYSTINSLDGKVEVVYIVQNLLDGKVAPTDRLGNIDAFAPLPSTVFKLGGHIVNNVPCVNSTLLGVFRYARMQASLFPFSFQAFTGSRIAEEIPSFIANIVGTNPKVGVISGYLEPLYGIFRVGADIRSKIDLYGCEIYADSANVSKIDGFVPGVISLSQSDSEYVAKILGSIVSPSGSFNGLIGNVGKVYGRIPYLLQVIEASPGIVTSIIGEASSIGATITASRSGDIIVISDIPCVKWHSSINNGVKCVILKYVRGV